MFASHSFSVVIPNRQWKHLVKFIYFNCLKMVSVVDTISYDNEVFRAFVFWSTIMCVKMLAMSILTGRQRFSTKVGYTIKLNDCWIRFNTWKSILDIRQPRRHQTVIKRIETKVWWSRCRKSSPGSSQRLGEHHCIHYRWIFLRADSTSSLSGSQSHQGSSHFQNRSHIRLRNLSNATGSCTRLVCLLRHHRLHGCSSSILLCVILFLTKTFK